MKKRARKSKNREAKSDENDPCSILPLELKLEILLKLVPESIARLGFVSNHWSSIIRGKDFTDLYLTRSLAKPRLLFSVYRRNTQTNIFHSCSQEDPSSDHRRVSYTLKLDLRYSFSPPIRGLIFGLNRTKALIGNPSTGQFVSLPRIKTRRKDIFSIFGYDPVNDLYKVLCMTVITRRGSWENYMWEPEPMSEEHQVFTLGAKQKWRMLDCKYLHRHYSGSQDICRNGVVYYLASYQDKRTLISFDLRSEEFDVTKLPEDDKLQQYGNLVNHTGKITIASNTNTGPLDLWILEDASKGEWSNVAAVVPSIEDFGDIFGNDKRTMVKGILRSGEIILSPVPSPNPFYFICYDPKEKVAREVVIEGIGDDFAVINVFFDHVESHMLVPKVT